MFATSTHHSHEVLGDTHGVEGDFEMDGEDLEEDDDEYYEACLDGELFWIPLRYRLIETRGQGSYGVVVSAKDRLTNDYVAIKKNKNVYPVYFPFSETRNQIIEDKDMTHRSTTSQKRILRELKILLHIGNHPNVVSIRDAVLPESFEEFTDVYMVMDLMECDLKTIIDSEQELTHEHIRFFMYQILISLHYIHAANILHRDLKPENLLLNSDCELKLCDFGLSRYLTAGEGMSTHFVVSRWYRSPELLLCNSSPDVSIGAIDIWSVGCIFAELIGTRRKVMFRGENPVDQLQKILYVVGSPSRTDLSVAVGGDAEAMKFVSQYRNIRPIKLHRMFPDAESKAVDLLARMLKFNPLKRVTAAQALRHPYFADFFSESDLATNPAPFDSEFEEFTTSPELKRECFETIRALMRREKDARLLRIRAKMRKIQSDSNLSSPIPENLESPYRSGGSSCSSPEM